MKLLFIGVAFFMSQMNTLQSKQVVHLQPRSATIEAGFGGKLVELQNAPVIVYLPVAPPKLDSQGNPWSVDIKNMGPGIVTLVHTSQFGISQLSVRIIAGQTVHVFSSGTLYSTK
jgi:hypothetical protein